MDNKAWVTSCLAGRYRPKNWMFEELAETVQDLEMAEMMWTFWGRSALETLDYPARALNPSRGRWIPFARKSNTIRSLLKTPSGREKIWRMLKEASSWLK